MAGDCSDVIVAGVEWRGCGEGVETEGEEEEGKSEEETGGV